MLPWTRSATTLLLAFLVAACGGGDSPTSPEPDDNTGSGGNGSTGTTGRQVIAEPSFSTHIQDIFQRNGCTVSGCHGAFPATGLDLRAGAAYEALVNVASTQAESRFLVVPNDAENSWLIVKVEGRQTIGQRMPIDRPALDTIDRTNLRNWIDTGAPNN